MNRKRFAFARILLAIAVLGTTGFFPQSAFAQGNGCEEGNSQNQECLTPTPEPTEEVTPTPAETQEEPEASCKLSISSQNLNVVEISFSVAGSGDYPGHIDWGDDSGFDVAAGSGQAGHGYAYNPGGVTEYSISLTVAGADSPCAKTVTIDDTPPPMPEASCALSMENQNLNVVNLEVSVAGQGDYPGHLDWGDGSGLVDLTAGTTALDHGYSYTVGGKTAYTATLKVDGAPALCVLPVQINDTPAPKPPDPNPSPSGNASGNQRHSVSQEAVPTSACTNADGSPRLPEQGMLICWHSLQDVEVWSNQSFNIQLGFTGTVLPGPQDGSNGLHHLRLQDPTGGKLILWGNEVGVRFRADGSQVFKAFESVSLGP